MPEIELELTDPQLPHDSEEYVSVAPDGASADGLSPTPGLPLETADRPDLEPGMTLADRWRVESTDVELSMAMAQAHVTQDGLALIESFEGFSATQYRDAVGIPTIGYGTTSAVIFPLPRTCTRAQAQGWLQLYVQRHVEPAIRGMGVPMNAHEFDACCSFGYNLGPGVFSSSSTFGRRMRAREFRQAASAMLMYDHAGGQVLAGLARRRRAESALFLRPMPAATDPHHLERFANSTFMIAGHRINERATVAKMYSLLEHEAQNRRQITALMPSLVLLRKRVWTVAHFEHPPSWAQDWRGWRWQALNHLTSTRI